MSIARKILMGSSGGKKSTYVDDVFSTYLYKGNNAANTVNTGINYSEEGGLLWIKARSSARQHLLFDTVRGANKKITSNENWAEYDGTGAYNQTFTTTGFTLNNSYTDINDINVTYSSWNFRKQKGFFDVVEYTGNGSNRNIQHALGCQPGCIMIKRTDTAEDWIVYHDGFYDFQGSNHYYLKLNSNVGQQYGGSVWNNTAPTSTNFRIGQSTQVNANGGTYVAYVFGGGSDRTTATSRSVAFGGNALTIPDSDDWNLGQTFTIEAWVNPSSLGNYNTIISQSDGGDNWYMSILANGACQFYDFDGGEQRDTTAGDVPLNQWTHIAFVGNSGTGTWYINGTPSGTPASIDVAGGSSGVKIGKQGSYSYDFNGKISNLRVVKGTAVYTSAFRPPTKPLTNITNTTLLCCNNTSVTGSTVTPGTITTEGTPSASIVTPFDDPEGFKFGEEGDSEVIKCGVYQGNANADGPEVFLGWEPEWVMLKSANGTENWLMFDSMRGIPTDENTARLFANTSAAESAAENFIDVTPTGFKIKDNGGDLNGSNGFICYIAIRRADGYVGKPAEVGTDAFTTVIGSSGAAGAFVSGFPVDFVFTREPANAGDWVVNARLLGPDYLRTNTSSAASTWASYKFDSNTQWPPTNLAYTTAWQGWMWKRGAGFDVVTYLGNGVGRQMSHNLSQTPEMIWVKNRGNATSWQCWHKDLNGGTNPIDYRIKLDSGDAESSGMAAALWNSTLPTSTTFSIGPDGAVNQSMAMVSTMLFASVDGISKVGGYTGTGNSLSITTGFSPRLLIIKNRSSSDNWRLLDTLRGWGAGDDQPIRLSATNAQSAEDFGAPTATGFTLTASTDTAWNKAGDGYIYYAHA